jgi:hypothetical protein
MSENLFAIFSSRFPADQDRAFIERPDGTTLGYADLLEISGRLASAVAASVCPHTELFCVLLLRSRHARAPGPAEPSLRRP